MPHFRYVRLRIGFWLVILALILGQPSSPTGQAAEVVSDSSLKTAKPYVDRAREYIKKGNASAAEIELRNAERAAPQDAQVRALLAQVYLQLRNFASAEREARVARDLDGTEASYLPVLAEAMLRQGKFADILAQVKPGDRAPALESRIRVLLATAVLGLHDNAKAETLLREAISLDESSPEPKVALAQLLLDSNFEEAEQLSNAALTINPHSADAIALKGQVLAKKGDSTGANARFAEAVAVDPNNVIARLGRANLNLNGGNFVAIDQDVDSVLKQSPDNVAANYIRASEYFKKHDFAAAARMLDKLSPMFAYMPEGFYVQAAAKYLIGQYGQADDAIAKYVARVPGSAQGARLAALIALRRSTPDAAVRYLSAYLAKSPPDATTLTLLGNVYLGMKKISLALEQYQKAAALEPENLSLKTMVAASEIDTGAGRKGLEDLENVFATEAGIKAAGPTLVLSELRAGRIDQAAAAAAKLVAHDKDNDLYQILLGLTQVSQKDYASAEAIFKHLIEKSPDLFPARNNLANTYMLAGRPVDAKKVYQDFLLRKPGDVSTLLSLADIAVRQQQLDQAIEYANQARFAARDNPAPGLKLLNIYASRQDWAPAKALARELTTQFPSNAQIVEAQGAVLLASGDRDGAIEAYQRAYGLAPDSAPILARYLGLLGAEKRFSEQRSILQARLDRDPSNREAKEQLIRVEAEIGGLDAGLATARSFARRDPANSFYDVVAADLYVKAGKQAEAIAMLEKSAAARPADDDVVVALSRLFSRIGDAAKAEAALKKRLQDRPDNVVLHGALADLYIKEKKIEPAIAEEMRVIAERPTDAAAFNNLAWLYQQAGDLLKARQFADRAAEIAPDNGAIADTLGWLLLAQGDVAKALMHIEAATAAVPGNLEIRYHLAVALDRSGRPDAARAILEKLLDSGASFGSKADAERLLQQLKRG